MLVCLAVLRARGRDASDVSGELPEAQAQLMRLRQLLRRFGTSSEAMATPKAMSIQSGRPSETTFLQSDVDSSSSHMRSHMSEERVMEGSQLGGCAACESCTRSVFGFPCSVVSPV